MLLSIIIYVHVLVYRRVASVQNMLLSNYICTCASVQESSKICC